MILLFYSCLSKIRFDLHSSTRSYAFKLNGCVVGKSYLPYFHTFGSNDLFANDYEILHFKIYLTHKETLVISKVVRCTQV